MDVGLSGIRIEGTWEEVVEFGQRISDALEAAGVEASTGEDDLAACYEAWEAWRPRPDDVEDEVRARTAEEASVGESEGEAEGVGVREDLADAGRKLDEATDHLAEKGVEGAAESVGESAERAARAADQAWRRALRPIEEKLYEHVMTRISPYYFDNALVSANLERVGEDAFVFEVKLKDPELRDAVEAHLGVGEDA